MKIQKQNLARKQILIKLKNKANTTQTISVPPTPTRNQNLC
jgi:hypothetical protein